MGGRQNQIVILGAGYTGRYLVASARQQERRPLASSRTPGAHLDWMPTGDRIEFDLARRETWANFPAGSEIIWCFPAAPYDALVSFAEMALSKVDRLVVLGSTSAYGISSVNKQALIDESTSIDLTRPRVRGEEHLRRHYHAIILRVAGIYGPGRSVLDWIRRGAVGSSPRYVNLIHVEDLAAICLLALERGRPGESYNVSDGVPRRWSEICEEARGRWGLTCRDPIGDDQTGKRISTAKLRNELGYTFRHPDLFIALDAIESAGRNLPPG